MWLLLLTATALAQDDAPPVVFHRGPLLTNAVVLGMGGASVAAAAGADGALSNPASFASLSQPEAIRFDALLALQALPAKDLLLPRRSPADGEPVVLLNPTVTLAQGSFGVGATLLGHGYVDRDQDASLNSWLLGAGGALTDGELSVGGELLLHRAVLRRGEDVAAAHGLGVELGARLRPEGSRFGVGASARTPIRSASEDGSLSVLVPAELAVGMAWDLEFFDRPLRVASDFILSAQTRGAVPADAWLVDPATAPLRAPQPSGSTRIGATWEAVEDQVRLRVGGYWEPGWEASGSPHATAGLDWHPPLPWSGPPWTQPTLLERVRLTVGLDMAEGYRRTALSVGLY